MIATPAVGDPGAKSTSRRIGVRTSADRPLAPGRLRSAPDEQDEAVDLRLRDRSGAAVEIVAAGGRNGSRFPLRGFDGALRSDRCRIHPGVAVAWSVATPARQSGAGRVGGVRGFDSPVPSWPAGDVTAPRQRSAIFGDAVPKTFIERAGASPNGGAGRVGRGRGPRPWPVVRPAGAQGDVAPEIPAQPTTRTTLSSETAARIASRPASATASTTAACWWCSSAQPARAVGACAGGSAPGRRDLRDQYTATGAEVDRPARTGVFRRRAAEGESRCRGVEMYDPGAVFRRHGRPEGARVPVRDPGQPLLEILDDKSPEVELIVPSR